MSDEHHGPGSGSRVGDLSDVLIAGAVWVLITGAVAAVIWNYRSSGLDTRSLWLSGIAGAALGWGTGLVLSPYDKTETSLFKGVGKLVYGLVTGYLVAKLDPIVTAAVDQAKTKGFPLEPQLIAAIGLTMFVASTVLTFVSRKYWR